MKRPPRTVVLAAALISGVAVAALILCTTLFLRSYRSAVVEGARTNSAQVVSQVAGAVDNYVNTMDSAVGIVLEQLDSEPAMRDAFLNAFLTARPEVAAITTYDESGSLLDCWAQAGRTPKSDILRNLSFDLTTARRLGHGYISTPHVESIFDSYYPWVVSVIRAVPGDTCAGPTKDSSSAATSARTRPHPATRRRPTTSNASATSTSTRITSL